MTPAQHSPCNASLALDRAEAVLLDMDGTLVLSEEVHRRSWLALFEAWGLSVTADEYQHRYMGRRPADVLADLADLPIPAANDGVEQAVATMTDFILREAHTVPAVPGAADLIQRLHAQGVPLAVVTSAGAAWAERILDGTLHVRELIDVVVTAEHVRYGKPSPEGYLAACRALGAAPDRCMAFEDSPSGVRALVTAGVVDIIGVTTTTTAGDLLRAGARWTVPALTWETLSKATPVPVDQPLIPHGRNQESRRP
ncbi:HAD family phosphatase [Streptomyces sp. NPDC094149]|uniref:HAD family hydrolase n=1 Tax=Streptomyces sp. NPDC094149 TaxID=3155079 RepID=UPI00332DC071